MVYVIEPQPRYHLRHSTLLDPPLPPFSLLYLLPLALSLPSNIHTSKAPQLQPPFLLLQYPFLLLYPPS